MSASWASLMDLAVIEEKRWREYLATLALQQPVATVAQLRAAERFWDSARVHGGAAMLPPITTLGEDETLRLAWNNARMYLEVTFDTLGRIGWFYRDTPSGTFEGTEDEWLEEVPARVFDLLPSFDSQDTYH